MEQQQQQQPPLSRKSFDAISTRQHSETSMAQEDCIVLSMDKVVATNDSMERALKSLVSTLHSVCIRQTSALVVVDNDETKKRKRRNRDRLFEAIGRLPNLEKLQLRYMGDTTSLPYGALSTVLRNAQQLRQLDISCSNVLSEDNDTQHVTNFLEALQHHPSLHEFNIGFSKKPVTSTITILDILAQTLLANPSIHTIHIYAKLCTKMGFFSGNLLSCSTVERLCQSPHMKTIKLGGIHLTKEHVQRMTHAIQQQNSSNLKELRLLSCGIQQECAIYVSHLLSSQQQPSSSGGSSSCLEFLDLSWNHIGDDGFQTIATALQQNKNSPLQGLYLYNDKGITSKSYPVVLELLQHNVTLHKLWMNMKDDVIVQQKVKFYLQLNASGNRRSLLRSTNVSSKNKDDEWIQALRSQQTNLSGLFYYLSHHPERCL